MRRSLLAFLLLANYLLVVGAGLVASRPEVPRFSAAHPYVHSKACQQGNYLRLDCFEQCNGEQYAATAKLPAGAGLHFLAQLKGLDQHCLPLGAAVPAATPRGVAANEGPELFVGAVPAGFRGVVYAPPRRG